VKKFLTAAVRINPLADEDEFVLELGADAEKNRKVGSVFSICGSLIAPSWLSRWR